MIILHREEWPLLREALPGLAVLDSDPPRAVASLKLPRPDALHFSLHSGQAPELPVGAALLLRPGAARPKGARCIEVDSPKHALAQVLWALRRAREGSLRQDPAGFWRGEEVSIGSGCRIAPGAVLESGVELGEGCQVEAGALLRSGVRVGPRCHVHPGAQLGVDGYGYAWPAGGGRALQLPHMGGLVLGEEVTVGPGSTLCAGTIDPTEIGDGVKIDGQVYVGHNARIGSGTMICAQSVIGGSDVLGRDIWVGPGCVLKHKISVGDKATLGIGSVVMKPVEPGCTVMGDTASEVRSRLRREARLDALLRQEEGEVGDAVES
jgi:UDP-3-O-[3-hydroxymyristoyl] glucosamine N-acyltransferase